MHGALGLLSRLGRPASSPLSVSFPVPVPLPAPIPLDEEFGIVVVDSSSDGDSDDDSDDSDGDVVTLRALHPSIKTALAVVASTDLSNVTIMLYEVSTHATTTHRERHLLTHCDSLSLFVLSPPPTHPTASVDNEAVLHQHIPRKSETSNGRPK